MTLEPSSCSNNTEVLDPSADSGSGENAATEAAVCGSWMPLARAFCGRGAGHPPGTCMSPEAMKRARQRQVEKTRAGRRIVLPAAKRRWNQAYKLSRYGLTPERFAWLLEIQGNACGMCREPFTENGVICVDHDHRCCDAERSSCGRCVRGLLCRSCNATLGHIERRYELAQAYLANPPAAALAAE
jgi:Recombination endonuclease VII